MNLDVHRLRLLRELDRRGTLGAVARALSYSPSAVSQQLSRLEAETGVALLEHVGRGVRLTPQGRILVGHADAVLERLARAEADLAASLDEVSGTLRVRSFQSVVLALIPASLAHLAQRHPHLRVEVVQSEDETAFAALLAHDVDLVLGEEYPGVPLPRLQGVHEEVLASDEMLLAVPPDGERRAIEDCADAAWALDPAGLGVREWGVRVCRDAGFEPDVRFESSDLLLSLHLVERGLAVTLVPHLLWTAHRPDVRMLHLPGRPSRRLFTGVRTGSAGHPAIRAFREALHHGLTAARTP